MVSKTCVGLVSQARRAPSQRCEVSSRRESRAATLCAGCGTFFLSATLRLRGGHKEDTARCVGPCFPMRSRAVYWPTSSPAMTTASGFS